MIQFKNTSWHGGTHNTTLRVRCAKESLERQRAYKYLNLAHYTAHLQYEMEQMWEEELLAD
jgi:hypothetical protein